MSTATLIRPAPTPTPTNQNTGYRRFATAAEPHHVTCHRCAVSYRATHYHCCLCRRAFGSASAFEHHQKAKERHGRPATDAALGRLGMFVSAEGAWKRLGTYSEMRYTEASTGGKAPARRGEPHSAEKGGVA